MAYHIIEKENPNALHGVFDSKERAERHLREVIPTYVSRKLFTDKTLKADSFEIVQVTA